MSDEEAKLRTRVAELEAELEGFRKANTLLLAGMESVCEGRDELKHRVRELETELSRYSMDAGHADQCRNVARAAVEALGMDWEETSPNDVTVAIKVLWEMVRGLEAKLHEIGVAVAGSLTPGSGR